jgi:hypothetical protein
MAFALRRFGSSRRRRSYSSMMVEGDGVLARLSRSTHELRRRQQEMHTLLAHHKSVVESLIVLQRPSRLATLRESYAKAKCAYLAPILRSYIAALAKSPSENDTTEENNFVSLSCLLLRCSFSPARVRELHGRVVPSARGRVPHDRSGADLPLRLLPAGEHRRPDHRHGASSTN